MKESPHPSKGAEHPTLRLAGGAGISFFGKAVGRLIQVVAQIAFARLLGMEDFGRYALGMTMVRMAGLIAPLGLVRGAVVFGARYWKVQPARFKGVVLETAGLAALSGTLIALALVGMADRIGALLFRSGLQPHVLYLFAWMVPFFAALVVVSELTRVSQRMQFAALAQDVVQPLLALTVFLALYAGGGRLAAAAAATALSIAIACGLAVRFLFYLFPESLRDDVAPAWNLGEILTFMAPTSLAVICNVCCAMLDRVIVGGYRSPQDMALYQAASQVSVAFTIILGSFTTIFSPMAARYFAAGDRHALGKLVRTSTNWGLYLALPLFAFFMVAPGDVLSVTFGTSYAQGALALVILASGQLVNVASGNVAVLMVVSGNQTRWLALAAAATVVNGAVGLLSISQWGILGAACGNLLGNVVLFGGGVVVVRARLGLWPYEARTVKMVVSATAAFAAGRVTLALSAGLPLALQLAAAAAAVLAAFAVASLALGVDEDERLLVRSLLRRVR